MITVFLNNIDISNNAEVDLSFVEKLDRELDEAFLVISHTDRKEQYDLYSIVDIFENNTLLFSGRVSSDLVELSSFGSELYNHNVSLIEHTKLLEKFIVKGKTFTQPANDPSTPLYTLYDVVESLRRTTLLQRIDIPDDIPLFVITSELQQELQEIIAPELSFKDVTLRQALDEVANILDSITRIDRAGTLIFDKFNELVNQIEFVTENYRKKQDVTDYATFLSSEVMNPVNESKLKNINDAEYYPAKNLWTTLRSSSIGQFDFSSSFIPTAKPIYEILGSQMVVEIKMGISEQPEETVNLPLIIDNPFVELDITENIVEKNVFDTLEDKDPGVVDPSSLLTFELTRRNVIIYNYARKGIDVGQTFGLFDIENVFPNLLNYAADKQIRKQGLVPSNAVLVDLIGGFAQLGDGGLVYGENIGTQNDPEFKWYQFQINVVGSVAKSETFRRWESLFRVEYVPIPPSIRYEVVRDDLTEVNLNSYGTINQKLRIVDLNAFTNNVKGRINQLSESELMLSHKVKKIEDSFNIGDFTEDKFVITKKEVIVQRDHYIINYELNRNFNKISQFVGIDQEIRQWEIGERGRSLDRELNYNEFIELYADDEGVGSVGNTTITSPQSLLLTFNPNITPVPISFGTFKSQDVLDDDGNILKLNVPFYKMSGGGAFGLYYEFETNASAGDALVEGEKNTFLGFGANRRFNVPVRYANDIGRFQNMEISFFVGETFPIGTNAEEFEDANALPEFVKTPQNELEVINGEFLVDKDNRERIKMSLLYHVISRDINEVVVGNKLLTHNSFFIETPNNIELRLFKDRIFTTRDKNSKLTGEEQKITTNFLEVNFPNMYIELAPSVDLTDIDAWAITDENGFPFIMVNKNSPLKRRVNFVFRNKHPQIKYTLHDIKTEVIELKASAISKPTLNSDPNALFAVSIANATLNFTADSPNIFFATGIANTTLDFTAEVTPATVINLSSQTLSTSALNFTAEITPATVLNLSASSIGNANTDIFANPALTLIANSTANAIIDITANPVLSLIATANAVGQLNIQ